MQNHKQGHTLKLSIWGLLPLIAACSTPVPKEAVNQPVAPAPMAADAAQGKSALYEMAPAPPPMPVAAPSLNMGSAAYAPTLARQSLPIAPPRPPVSGEQQYEDKIENPVKRVSEQPVSTFSVDVDTGSYTNVRQQIWRNQSIDPRAIRAEEFINYFEYQYPDARDRLPFSVNTLLTSAPWDNSRQLLRIALKARDVKAASLPPTNLVYLVDVSGSMYSPDKLDLIKQALVEMVEQLRPQDKISLVTYSGSTAVVLPATSGAEKEKIKSAIAALTAGGSTAGGAGIQLAYEQAKAAFIKDGINRILLLTDGDFNVGISDTKTLKEFVAKQRQSGIGLSTLGVGDYRFNDGLMEQLADVGDGKYSYLDSLGEARKVLIHEMSSTLATVAKDVKIQVEFNPAYVQEYRLLGYDNRQLKREDFNNDQVDSGDVGAGHTVTAIYEITPVGAKATLDPLRYGADSKADVDKQPGKKNNELAYVRLRYKSPNEDKSQLIERPVLTSSKVSWAQAGQDMYWATAAASFAFKLQGRSDIPQLSWDDLISMAKQGNTQDKYGQKQEMLALLEKARLQVGGK